MPDGVPSKKMNIDQALQLGWQPCNIEESLKILSKQSMIKYPLTFNSFDDEDSKAVYELFGTGYLTQGNITKQYETKLCDEFGCNYVVANSAQALTY